jgi:hypothetical protein
MQAEEAKKQDECKENEFNAELKRQTSNSDSDFRKPRSSSFIDSENFVYRSGAFVRPQSAETSPSGSMSHHGMPDFRTNIRAQLNNTKDDMPQGAMREMMETYKPHILNRRRRLIEDCVRDLRLNNDHIHIVEQEMRKSIQVLEIIRNSIRIICCS